jgi:hypothetical protein
MTAVQSVIEAKFLSVCTSSEAVAWLREKRQGTTRLNSIFCEGNDSQEEALVARCDPYIDFSLARYGMCAKAGKEVYARGDTAIRYTFLACFPNGGFATLFDNFDLADESPKTVDELSALVSNPSLTDDLLKQCFEKKKLFEHLSEEEIQTVLVAAADNPRLVTPYNETFMDGWSDYSYHSVFSAAWKLAETAPNTMRWASVVYHLLNRCLSPVDFNSTVAIPRWHFEVEKDKDQRNIGFYLRSRLADVLRADEALLKSSDPALRDSFYKRFHPSQFPQWPHFAKSDPEYFLDAAMQNMNLWVSGELREWLSQLCWAHPDPSSLMDMPNRYRGMDKQMRSEHPEWFVEEG